MALLQPDIPHLSSYLSLPEASFTELLNTPTTELVSTLLQAVAAKAREHQQAQSENLKLRVELENAVRTSEARSRALKASVDKALKEAADLRGQLQNEETSKQALQTELNEAKSSTSSSSNDLSTLRARVEQLESLNRDTVTSLESKIRAYDDLSGELSAKHQKVVELRRDIAALEQSVRSTNASVSSAQSREQSLQQEVESLKRTNDWLDQELKTKNNEHVKYRKEKGARITELQRQNDDSAMTIEELRRKEQTLHTRLEEVSQKADDFLGQIQKLRDHALQQEENWRTELDSTNRLAELMKASADTEKKRQQDLAAELESVRENATSEIGKIFAESQTEHQERVIAEQRIAELEIHIERLEKEVAIGHRTVTAPGSPSSRLNGSMRGTLGLEMSPSRMPSPSPMGVKGLSFTQMITDYHAVKSELEAEKRRNEKLSATIDEMIQDMESRQPEIAELQADHDRLEKDIVDMSKLVDSVSKDRDQARKDARKWEGQVAGLVKEADIHRQQLRDLSAQIKVLIMEVNRYQDGADGFSADERARLERLAKGGVDDEMSDETTSTDRFISLNLTTFKSIKELQEKNETLLRLTRELGSQMEGEEAQLRKSQASQNLEELQDLRQKYERCKDEIKSIVTQSQSYIRERDMFRRMLSQRGQISDGGVLSSPLREAQHLSNAPVTPSQPRVFNSVELSPASKELSDYAKLLKDMQSHFDTYRQEAASDRTILKEQVDTLSKKNGELRAEVSRRNTEVSVAVERYEMLQGNYNMLKSENAELQRRAQSSSDRFAKQDLRLQQVAEDLVEAKGLMDSMRSELANLKAEKEFWKSIEKRLTDDNKNLIADHDQLSTMNANLQSLLNEREHFDADSRRRVQLQLETVEVDLQQTRRKLNEEAEENKRATLRRELDSQHSQKRIDDLMTSLSMAREELAAAKTARDHLQARVEELSVELHSAEERLQVLQTPSSIRTTGPQQDGTAQPDIAMDREQELALHVSELQRDLQLAQNSLTDAQAQVEQYKAISQSSEEELQSLNSTLDEYKIEMDRIIEEKSDRISELEHSIQTVQMQMNVNITELSSLRAEHASQEERILQQRDAYVAEIERLKDLNERNESAAQLSQEDVKAQAEITRQAQQNYNNELMKHAEAAKMLQVLRAEYNQLKLEIVELKTDAETARTKLVKGEENWIATRDRYEHELIEVKSRRDDIVSQNKLLHKQLESFTDQIAALQKTHSANFEDGNDDTSGPQISGTENLQELIKYLRREKEIVDVQYELSVQESKRVRQHLEHTQSQLDEARLKLSQQRHAEENSERTALTHQKLMDTINELNLNRESNSTLRLEKSQAQATLAEKVQEIEDLQARIQPLESKVRELEDMSEVQAEEVRMAREAKERYEQRYLDVLHKSDSIDPAEVEALREKISSLESELSELQASRQVLQEQVDGHEEHIKQSLDQLNERHQDIRNKLVEQSKTKNKQQVERIREKDTALQIASQEKQALELQLERLKEELNEANTTKEAAADAQNAIASTLPTETHVASEDGQVDDVIPSESNAVSDLRTQLDLAHAQAEEELAKRTQMAAEVAAAQIRINGLEKQLMSLQEDLDRANEQVAKLLSQQQQVPGQVQDVQGDISEVSSDEIEQLRRDLSHAQDEAESLKAAALTYERGSSVNLDDGSSSVTEQIAAQVEAIRQELSARHEQRIREAQTTMQSRVERMKSMLNQRLATDKAETRATIETLKQEHEQEIEALNVRYQSELDELRRTQVESSTALVQAASSEATSRPISELDESEVRTLLRENPIAKGILVANLNNRLAKERELISTKTREEQEKIMVERLAEAEKIKIQAVEMEGKKVNVKLSISENKARQAIVKLEYVQKTATETPERPIAEVWAVAKDLKAGPAVTPQLSTVNPSAPSISPSKAAGTATVPVGSFGLPSSSQSTPSSTNVSGVTETSGATAGITTTPGDIAKTSAIPSSLPSNPFKQAMNGVQANGSIEQSSKLPNAPSLPQSARSSGVGTGALRGLQSGLPLPSGGRGAPQQAPTIVSQHARGNMNMSRGRGRGGAAGRGGLPAVQTNVAQINQPAQSGSKSQIPLSAGATQFVPQGTKRPRDDSTGLGGSQHANEKRVRGNSGA